MEEVEDQRIDDEARVAPKSCAQVRRPIDRAAVRGRTVAVLLENEVVDGDNRAYTRRQRLLLKQSLHEPAMVSHTHTHTNTLPRSTVCTLTPSVAACPCSRLQETVSPEKTRHPPSKVTRKGKEKRKKTFRGEERGEECGVDAFVHVIGAQTSQQCIREPVSVPFHRLHPVLCHYVSRQTDRQTERRDGVLENLAFSYSILNKSARLPGPCSASINACISPARRSVQLIANKHNNS